MVPPLNFSLAYNSMTDGAEKKSEEYASLALKYDPDSPVALYLLASIRLSQSRNEEAAEVCKQSLSKWLGKPSVQPPTFAERISLVKILLELDMYEEALSVLETLQREDDENVELWYFYTCAYYHDTKESKEESWKNALECAETCLKLYQKMEWDDEELRKSCEGMVEEIRVSGVSVDKEDVEANEDDEEDWELESDEDVEMEDAN
jgi:tetratricopeptide (TPR) repeat protein